MTKNPFGRFCRLILEIAIENKWTNVLEKKAAA
jgi:hypothetical protein